MEATRLAERPGRALQRVNQRKARYVLSNLAGQLHKAEQHTHVYELIGKQWKELPSRNCCILHSRVAPFEANYGDDCKHPLDMPLWLLLISLTSCGP